MSFLQFVTRRRCRVGDLHCLAAECEARAEWLAAFNAYLSRLSARGKHDEVISLTRAFEVLSLIK